MFSVEVAGAPYQIFSHYKKHTKEKKSEMWVIRCIGW